MFFLSINAQESQMKGTVKKLNHHCDEGVKIIPINNYTRVPEPLFYTQRRALNKPAFSTITIHQVTGNPPNAAIAVVNKAIDIWSQLISSSQPIHLLKTNHFGCHGMDRDTHIGILF